MDPFRPGSGNDLCPIAAVMRYLSQRGGQPGLLFYFKDGRFLTRSHFVDRVRDALHQAGIDASKFAGHSFRWGATTTTLEKDISNVTIKMLGLHTPNWQPTFMYWVNLVKHRTSRPHLTHVPVFIEHS